MYMADGFLHRIQKFKQDGEFISKFGSKGAANEKFWSPNGLALSQSQLLFVCDTNNNKI